MTFLFMDICADLLLYQNIIRTKMILVVELINKYLDTMTKIILSHGEP